MKAHIRAAIGAALLTICAASAGAAEYQRAQGHEHVHSHPPGHVQPQDPEDSAQQAAQSGPDHVPPLPPQRLMPDMSNKEMIALMQMDDNAAFSMLLVDQLEWSRIDSVDTLAWEAQAWFGNDYDKLWLKSEGEGAAGDYEGRTELLWDRVIGRWWSLQAGVRNDFGEGPARTWAAVGVQGLAPQWFEIEATVYAGEQGRTALRVAAEHEVHLTQRLILQSELELTAYGQRDVQNEIGSGLSATEFGLRLRYEVRREFAPYVGAGWRRAYGNTADLLRNEDRSVDDLHFIAGLRVWF